MVALNRNYMAKSKAKADYKQDLLNHVSQLADKLTIKQLRQLIAKYQ